MEEPRTGLRPSRAFVVLAGVVAGLLPAAAACGGDGDAGADRPPPAAPTEARASGVTTSAPSPTGPPPAAATASAVASAGSPSVDPASVATFTGDEICALVTPERVGSALGGLAVTGTEVAGEGPPACTYAYAAPDGAPAELTLAVLRPVDDLGGAVGAAGHDAVVARVAGDAGAGAPEEVASIGDRATWFPGPPAVLVASRADQVVTVSGAVLSQEQAGALANMLLSEVT